MCTTQGNRKALIVFSSKKGTTRDCAQKVQQALGISADLYDPKQNSRLHSLDAYDYVVIGTPLYMGKILSTVKQFCTDFESELQHKHLAFFTCGLGTAEEDIPYLRQCLPASLVTQAIEACHFGGEARFDKMNFLERFAMKEFIKQRNPVLHPDDNIITSFCEKLNTMWK